MKFFFKNINVVFYTWFILILVSILTIAFYKKESIDIELKGLNHTTAYQVKRILEDDFNFKQGGSIAVVIEKKIEPTTFIGELKTNFEKFSKIVEYKGFKEHKNTLIYIEFSPKYTFDVMHKDIPVLREYLKTWGEKNHNKAFVTGNIAFQYDAKKAGKEDSLKGEVFALIISFFILIFNFGALVSAFLPLLIGFSTIVFTYALIKIFQIPVTSISQILTSLIGLALAIDYSLFIVSRFREELKNNLTVENSLVNTLLYSGKTILFSGLIMICSILSLLFPDVSVSKTIVVNIVLAITVSLVNSLIFLPILLVKFNKYLDKPAFLTNLINRFDRELFWKNFTIHVVKYSKLYFISSVILLLSLAYPVLFIKIWSPVQSIAPKNSESIQAYNLLEQDGWGGELIPITIVVKANKNNEVYSQNFIYYIYELTKKLEKNPKISYIQSLTSLNKDMTKEEYFNLYNSAFNFGMNQKIPLVNANNANNTTLINVYPKNFMNVQETMEIVDEIQTELKNNTTYETLVGGLISRVNDFSIELYAHIFKMLLVIFVSIFILLFFHTKSIILPIKASIMNFLPILSSYGILVLIFQYGYFSSIIHTPINNGITNIIPIVLFSIIFGLGMDYEVLILSRISESYHKGNDVKTAIIEGMSKSGSIITGAALILFGVFIPGMFSSTAQIQELCIGIATSIFIDATIVRLFLVPSFMLLMGKWNWWNPFK